MPLIHALSQAQAEKFVPGPEDVLISIATPPVRDRSYPTPDLGGWMEERILRLWFHDCDPDYTYGQNLISMNEEDARRLLRFVADHPGKNVFIHCWAGKSRSYTIARFLASNFDYDLADYSRNCHVNYWVWYCLTEALDPELE